jgi:hypothetical protein
MTTQEVLYAEVKPDISTVATPLFEVSERCLRDMGNFLPHAAVLTAEGKVEIVGAAPDSKDGYADSTQVLLLLHDGLRAMAKEKALVAIGIAENVTITPDGQAATQAIKVLFEHSRGLTVALYLPFAKKFLRGYSFGETFSVLAAPEVNAWKEA